MVFSCLLLFWRGKVFYIAWESMAPAQCYAFFCLTFHGHMLLASCIALNIYAFQFTFNVFLKTCIQYVFNMYSISCINHEDNRKIHFYVPNGGYRGGLCAAMP